MLYSGKIMALWQGKSQRSKSGRRIRYHRSKRRFEVGREIYEATIGAHSVKIVRGRSNTTKFALKTDNVAYVIDPKTHKAAKADVLSVIDNPANMNYIRRNIITKGAIINTSLGQAQVTSRPGQTGSINAVLIEKQQ